MGTPMRDAMLRCCHRWSALSSSRTLSHANAHDLRSNRVAGLIAVQVAKQLGAGKVIVTGRNAQKHDTLRPLGAMLSAKAVEDTPCSLRPGWGSQPRTCGVAGRRIALLRHPNHGQWPQICFLPRLLEGIRQTFDLASYGKLYLPTTVALLSTITEN